MTTRQLFLDAANYYQASEHCSVADALTKAAVGKSPESYYKAMEMIGDQSENRKENEEALLRLSRI